MSQESGRPVHPLRILIIEDTLDRQQILTQLYRAHAWVLVDTAPRAIILLHAYPFDLVSLDYNIKGDQNGEAVALALKASPNRDCKVVIHSMNPQGAARLSQLLPEAIRLPVQTMIKSNARFRRLRQALDEQGLAFDWRLDTLEGRTGDGNKPE